MADSVVEICNLALAKVASPQRISDLSENTLEAKMCNLLYPQVRDWTLRDYPWRCALKRDSLAELDITNNTQYTYVYQLPTDPKCLRVLGLIDNDTREFNPYLEFMVEGEALYCNYNPCVILYIQQLTDPKKYDPGLVEAISLRLAVELAVPIAQSVQLKQALMNEYEMFKMRAVDQDGQERSQRPVGDVWWSSLG